MNLPIAILHTNDNKNNVIEKTHRVMELAKVVLAISESSRVLNLIILGLIFFFISG